MRWRGLDPKLVSEFSSDGLVNEYALLYHVRHTFPLSFIVFRQAASHLFHEGNTENVFSRSGALTDPNMDPSYLGKLTSISVNAASSMPPSPAIFARYKTKFNKNGGLEKDGDDLGLTDPDAP